MKKVKLIINADDLGASIQINDRIIECIVNRSLTSVSILANGPAFEDAVRRIKDLGTVSIGAHLNCMEFKPLYNGEFGPLIDDNGEFNGSLFKINLNRAIKKTIENEWLEQINKIRDHSITISHIDSHFHTHTHFGLFFTLRNVLVKSGIKRLRTTKNLYSDLLPPGSPLLLLKKKLWHHAVNVLSSARTTDGFCELTTFNHIFKKNVVHKKIIELMTHPGAAEFTEDDQLLNTNWMKPFENQISLITYNDI